MSTDFQEPDEGALRQQADARGWRLEREGNRWALRDKIVNTTFPFDTLANVEAYIEAFDEFTSEQHATDVAAAEDLRLLRDEWIKLSPEKRGVIAEACPMFGAFFGVIYRQ